MKNPLKNKRIVFKKGKYVITRKGSIVLKLANQVKEQLKSFSKKIQIVGSIRRKHPEPVDIDILITPKNKNAKNNIKTFLREKVTHVTP